MNNVSAVLTELPGNVTVIDGALNLVDIPTGMMATDAFKIRIDRTGVFDESKLKFTFSHDAQ